jgi:hypothetical protein
MKQDMGVFFGTRVNPDAADPDVPDNSVLPIVTLVCGGELAEQEGQGRQASEVKTVTRQEEAKARRERQ